MHSGRLTTKRVAELVRGGRQGHWSDGGNLYLRVGGPGKASWVFRYRTRGRLRDAGLGSYDTWGLVEARSRARRLRQSLSDGVDPIDERRAERDKAKVIAARAMTFMQCAEAYIAAHRAEWKNAEHARQWPSSLIAYVYPVLGSLPVAAIDTALVMKVLEPIWLSKPETAKRVRGRIERVLDFARTRGFRQGENPARWRGHLDQALPKPSKAKAAKRRESGQGEHLAALPYAELPAFMARLRALEGVAARALEFAILTACRTGEVLGARWSEIDLTERLWTIPGDRMKSGKEHRIPLSGAAMALLAGLTGRDRFVFPAAEPGSCLRDFTLYNLLKRIGCAATVHGFRSTFSTWAIERTNFTREERELALAHNVGSLVERSYRRTDLFERRRRLMRAWARFLSGAETGEVIPLVAGPWMT
jgi:integrase